MEMSVTRIEDETFFFLRLQLWFEKGMAIKRLPMTIVLWFLVVNINRLSEFECECFPIYEPKVQIEWFLRDDINGCKRKLGEQAFGHSNTGVGFIKVTSVKIPDTTNAIVNGILGLKDCRDLCVKNCSCTAYSNANVSNGGSGCITGYGDLIDTRMFSNGGQDVYIRVTASELAQYLKNLKGHHTKKLIIILVASAADVLLLVFAIWLALWTWKDKRRNIRKLLSFNLSQVSSYEGSIMTKE